jgi:tetratricopeptide (TPR) repeat protein
MAMILKISVRKSAVFGGCRRYPIAVTRMVLALLLAGMSLSACAAVQLPRAAVVPVDQFQPFIGSDGNGIVPSAVSETLPDTDILALSSYITAILDASVIPVRNPGKRLDALIEVLVQRIRYDTAQDKYGAKTARETFETGTANCLSFSNVFVATARYVGLKAGFLEVPVPLNWAWSGEVLFFTLHIGAYVDINERNQIQLSSVGGHEVLVWGGSRRYLVAPYELGLYNPDIDPHAVRTIPDRRAFAEYYNNIGAMHLAMAENETAFRYFVKALKTYPDLNFAWSNLGVLYGRNGQADAAEAAYLQGLTVSRAPDDAGVMPLMSNMANLYRRVGAKEKAEYYEDEVAGFRQRNPYYHYAVAKAAYHDARYAASVDSFKKAIRRKGDEPLFYYGIALAYYQLGDLKKMSESFDKAKRYAWDDDAKAYYDSEKERLLRPLQ